MATKKENRKKQPLLGSARQYGVTLLIGAALSLGLSIVRGFRLGQAAYLNARHLSDGCFVVGLLMLGVGGLNWAASTGFFDIFSYGVKSVPMLFSPLKDPAKHRPQDFYDYKQTQEKKRKHPLYFLVIMGVFFLLLAALCLGLYYNLPMA